MHKHKVELGLVLPEEAYACGACTQRLVQGLTRSAGVLQVHVDRSLADAPKLCLHYDPSVLSLRYVDELARRAGADIATRYAHLSVPLSGLRHERQTKLVEGVLTREPGVLHATADFGLQRLYVEFDPALTNSGAVMAAAQRAGVSQRVEVDAHDDHADGDHAHGAVFGRHTELIFSLGCGLFTAVGWASGKFGGAEFVATCFFVGAYLLGSWFTLQEVLVALRARRFEIDFLMLLAAAGAAVLGEWFEGSLLLFLFTIGHALEGFAMRRARNAIAALSNLVPTTALRMADGREEEVALDQLRVGDRLLVKPNTQVPADGLVAQGTSAVNQAPITGESVPADKRPLAQAELALTDPEKAEAEHRVFAGTLNGAGALTILVAKPPADSTLAKVVRLIAEAQSQKSPTQQFTDRFERLFVPAILLVVFLLPFACLVIDEPAGASFYRALAVLVAASPCALAIATPSAVLAGIARAARRGVLIKGGAHLEALGSVRAIAFDKTGTLTEGKPRLTDVQPYENADRNHLLATAVAIERRSDHPLAIAIASGGADLLGAGASVPEASDVEAIVGFGVRGKLGREEVLIGKPGLFQDSLPAPLRTSVQDLQARGRTVMIVRTGPRFLGALGVMDTPRESAGEVIAELHRLGITRTVMLTGDNQAVADAVAKQVGLASAMGDLLPDQKVAHVVELAASAPVAMVGDGVNDAPALASATVGIAMGAGGSDVALETADVALMGDDLRALPFAIGLSREARRIIRQNLWASLGMVAFLVPASILGLTGIGLAVVFHEGSTLLVVANALRLLAYRERLHPAAADSGTSQGVRPGA